MANIRGPLPDQATCSNCPLAVNGLPKNSVRGYGPDKPLYIVIGEGPGHQEVRDGLPMVGPSGKLLNKAITAVGGSRSEVYVTNTTLCIPRGAGEKDKLVEAASKHCRQRLEQELAQFDSSIPILLAGKHAAQAFLGTKFKITELAGSYHEVDFAGTTRRVIPTIHPAAILRGGSGESRSNDLQFWGLLYDCNKINKLAKGTQELFSEDIYYEAHNAQRAMKLVEWICREARIDKYVACDTETLGKETCNECPSCEGHSALESMHAKLNVIGLATEKYAVSVPWGLLDSKHRKMIKDLLEDEKITKTFHNRIYDEVVLRYHDIKVSGRRDDTLYMHHNAFPGAPHGLQKVATQFFLIKPWKSEHDKDGESLEDLLRYNALDTLATARLPAKLRPCLDRANTWQTYEVDLKKIDLAMSMQIHGVPIDLDRSKMLLEYFMPMLEQSKANLLSKMEDGEFKNNFREVLTLGQAKFKRKKDGDNILERQIARQKEFDKKFEQMNLNSGQQVAAFLAACGITLTAKTKTGKISTTKDILEGLIGHEVVRDLLKYRNAAKSVYTFVEPFTREVYKDIRVHPTWSPNKISGRFGSKRNVQNWSSGASKGADPTSFEDWHYLFMCGDDPGDPNLRWQVVAPPGRKFVGADYKQLEARVVGLLSKDAWLCEMFSTNQDVHSILAADVFPQFNSLPKGQERKFLRDLTKNCEYAFLYGAAVTTAWQQMAKEGINVPIIQIVQAFNAFKKRMPTIPIFHASLYKQVMEKGYIQDFLLGRKRFFPLGQPDDTILKNFICQSSGAAIADMGILRLHEALPEGTWILKHDHDSVLIECDESNAEIIKALAIEKMTQTYEVDGVKMVFGVDAKIGNDWGSV